MAFSALALNVFCGQTCPLWELSILWWVALCVLYLTLASGLETPASLANPGPCPKVCVLWGKVHYFAEMDF